MFNSVVLVAMAGYGQESDQQRSLRNGVRLPPRQSAVFGKRGNPGESAGGRACGACKWFVNLFPQIRFHSNGVINLDSDNRNA
jgi:hypothetical protein